MMLDSALGFERLVKNPKAGSKESGGKTQVTWDNPPELEAYIDKLQAAADKLTSENRRLRKYHHNICDKVRAFCASQRHCYEGLSKFEIFVVVVRISSNLLYSRTKTVVRLNVK